MLHARAWADSPHQDVSMQQPATSDSYSQLCQTYRISCAACRSPAGAAQHRMRSNILQAAHGLCWGLCGCWSPTPTLISSVLLGDAPAGWSSRAQESHTVASANVNRSMYRKPLLLLEEHGSGASITSAELKQQFSSEVSSQLSEMKGKEIKALSCIKEGSCWI